VVVAARLSLVREVVEERLSLVRAAEGARSKTATEEVVEHCLMAMVEELERCSSANWEVAGRLEHLREVKVVARMDDNH
jgi:hypothetical protein